MNENWSLRALRWSYAAFIAYASMETFLGSRSIAHFGAGGVRVLSAVEFLAALVLASGMLDRFAVVTLLVVYAIAALLSVTHGEMPLRFLYYAVTALFFVQGKRNEPAAQ